MSILQNAHQSSCEWRHTICPETFVNIPHFDNNIALVDDFDKRFAAIVHLLHSSHLFKAKDLEKKLTISVASIADKSKLNNKFSMWKEMDFSDQVVEMALSHDDMEEAVCRFYHDHQQSSTTSLLKSNKGLFVERLLIKFPIDLPEIRFALMIALFGWDVQQDSVVKCKLCSREVNLEECMNSKFEIAQCHRHFCPWVNKQVQISYVDNNIVGYEYCQRVVHAYVGSFIRKQDKDNHESASNSSKNRRSLDEGTLDATITSSTDTEQAYKRIRLILSEAAATMNSK